MFKPRLGSMALISTITSTSRPVVVASIFFSLNKCQGVYITETRLYHMVHGVDMIVLRGKL